MLIVSNQGQTSAVLSAGMRFGSFIEMGEGFFCVLFLHIHFTKALNIVILSLIKYLNLATIVMDEWRDGLVDRNKKTDNYFSSQSVKFWCQCARI